MLGQKCEMSDLQARLKGPLKRMSWRERIWKCSTAARHFEFMVVSVFILYSIKHSMTWPSSPSSNSSWEQKYLITNSKWTLKHFETHLAVGLEEAGAVRRDERVEFHMIGFFLGVARHLLLAERLQFVQVVLKALHLFATPRLFEAESGQVLQARLFNLSNETKTKDYVVNFQAGSVELFANTSGRRSTLLARWRITRRTSSIQPGFNYLFKLKKSC